MSDFAHMLAGAKDDISEILKRTSDARPSIDDVGSASLRAVQTGRGFGQELTGIQDQRAKQAGALRKRALEDFDMMYRVADLKARRGDAQAKAFKGVMDYFGKDLGPQDKARLARGLYEDSEALTPGNAMQMGARVIAGMGLKATPKFKQTALTTNVPFLAKVMGIEEAAAARILTHLEGTSPLEFAQQVYIAGLKRPGGNHVEAKEAAQKALEMFYPDQKGKVIPDPPPDKIEAQSAGITDTILSYWDKFFGGEHKSAVADESAAEPQALPMDSMGKIDASSLAVGDLYAIGGKTYRWTGTQFDEAE